MYGKQTAEEYKKSAVQCIELAPLMSIVEDRNRLLEMARHWLELAAVAESAGE